MELPAIVALADQHGRKATLAAVRAAVERIRARGAGAPARETSVESLVQEIGSILAGTPRRLRRVVNGTGVVIHTNLGRAPVAAIAASRAVELAASYSNLELDLATGRRGDRQSLLVDLLCRMTGAEAAMVVNNGAAAVLLGLAALCPRREVVVSRGEAIEIGGGFRIPEILRLSGARLVEVGTTNRTRVSDYLEACSDRTAAFLRVHQSNFRMEGFVQRPAVAELARAAHERGVLLLEDVGSGLVPPPTPAGAAEDRLSASSAAGVDLIFSSGDKLLGASQAGLVMGRGPLVEKMRRHPLARALRPDKLQLAVLEETLLCYEAPGRLAEIPVWRMLNSSPGELRARAERWALTLTARGVDAEVVPLEGAVGGGTTPGPALPSHGVLITTAQPGAARRLLLRGDPPVLCLERATGVAVDARCVLPEEEGVLLSALSAAFGGAA